MGMSWTGIKKARKNVTREKPSVLLAATRALADAAALGAETLRGAIEPGELADSKNGQGSSA